MFFFADIYSSFLSGVVGNLRQDRADRFFYLQQSGNDLAQLLQYVQRRLYFPHLSVTITETLVSFLFVVVLGAGMAVLLWTCPRLAKITEPYLVVLNSLPKSALAPLLIVWLGANERTIIVCGMSVAIFGSILNLYTGFGEADPEKLKLIETLGGGKKEKLMKIILPSSVPLLLSVMKVNIGLCLVGVIIGEFIGARKGLGYLIIYSSQTFAYLGTDVHYHSVHHRYYPVRTPRTD